MKKAIGRNILIVLCVWVLSACGGLSTNAAGLTPTATAVDTVGAVSSPTAIVSTEMVAPTGTADSTQAVVSTTRLYHPNWRQVTLWHQGQLSPFNCPP